MRTTHRAYIAAAVLLGVTLLAGREPILLAVGDYLIVQDELQPADVIHVIAGADYRTDYGIQLYEQGLGKRLFFTGGWCKEIQGDHGERATALAMAQGVPVEAISTDSTPVTSTYAEVVRLQAFIAQSPEPVHSVTVVSDPFHMRRAQWTYRQVLGPTVRVQMTPVPFDVTPFSRRWWTDVPSQHYVESEYGKLVYYLARYGLNWRPLSQWLASFDVE